MLTYVKIYEEEKPNKDTKIIPSSKKGGSAERTKMLSKPRYLCMTGRVPIINRHVPVFLSYYRRSVRDTYMVPDCTTNPTVKSNGKVRLHKVKKTSATSYHIGRTWHLDEIKSIENVDVSQDYGSIDL